MGKDNLATLDKSVHNEVTYEFFKNSNIIMRALNFYFSQLVFPKNISTNQCRSVAMTQNALVEKVIHF